MKSIQFNRSQTVWFDAKPNTDVYQATNEARKFIVIRGINGCFLEFNGYLFYIRKDSFLNELRMEYFDYLNNKTLKNEKSIT